VELCLQGQGDGRPVVVLGQGGQDDPDVAVDVLLACGPRAGVVMDATALDEGAVAGGGGVVDAQQQALGVEQGPDGGLHGDGHVVGLSTDGTDSDVALAPVGGEAAGTEPGGDGAATSGQEEAQQQRGQAGGGSLVQPVGQADKGAGQKRG